MPVLNNKYMGVHTEAWVYFLHLKCNRHIVAAQPQRSQTNLISFI